MKDFPRNTPRSGGVRFVPHNALSGVATCRGDCRRHSFEPGAVVRPETVAADDPAASAAPDPGVHHRRWTALLWPALGAGLALWAIRHAFGPGLPSGTDIGGNLERIQFGLAHFAEDGHVDGWFPRSMLGYQEFLIYGPGLSWLVGVVEVCTFGLLSVAGALKVVVIGAYVATPAAMAYLGRSVGLDRWAAGLVGIAALTVSSDRGGGLEGLFLTGLVSQHVALPVLLVGLGAIVRVWRGERNGARAIAVAAVAFLLITHPPSVVLFVWLAVVLVGAVMAFDPSARRIRRGLRGVGRVGAIAAGTTAFWLVPAAAHHDLTGPVTSFDTAGLAETLRLLLDGQRGYHGWMGRLALVAILIALVAGVRGWRDPARRVVLILAVVGPAALVGAVLMQEWAGPGSLIGLQLNNRGLVVYALLALLPLGWVASAVAVVLRRRMAVAGPVVIAGAILLVVIKALSPLAHHVATVTPVPAMYAAAQYLHDNVATTARFVVHDAPGRRRELGVEVPARWLGWKADRDELNAFVPEVAPEPDLIGLVATPLDLLNVDDWVDHVRRLAVSHIVTWDDNDRVALEESQSVREVLRSGLIAVFAIVPKPGAPVGSLVDVPSVSSQHVDDGDVRVVYTSASADDAPVALGWSPKWHATVDGRPVPTRRSTDNELLVALPAGTHQLVLRFTSDGADALGRWITVVTILALIAGWQRSRARIANDRRVGAPS